MQASLAMFTAEQISDARAIIREAMPSTPQYAWPLLQAELGVDTWVKHENHTPTGAFKVRGGLVHMRKRIQRGETNGVITATRGNHGMNVVDKLSHALAALMMAGWSLYLSNLVQRQLLETQRFEVAFDGEVLK